MKDEDDEDNENNDTIDEGATRDVEYFIKCIDRIEEPFFCNAEVFENFEWDQD